MVLWYGNSNNLPFPFFLWLYNCVRSVKFDLAGGLNFKILKNFMTILK